MKHMNTSVKRSRNHSGLSTDRYYNLFQHSPISIGDEDFSQVKQYFDSLKKQGVSDFREYFTSNPEEVISVAQKVRILSVNEATLKMYEAADEKELFQGLNTIFNKHSYNVFREELIALAEGKTIFFSEAKNLSLKGEEKHILLKLVVLPGYEESLAHVFVYIIDISDIKRMEARLKKSELKYRLIVKGACNAILVTDAESGIVLEANKKAEELLGIAAEEIVGMHFTQLYPIEDANRYEKLFEEHIKESTCFTDSVIICRKNGDRLPVTISSSIVELSGKKCIAATFSHMLDERKVRSDMKKTAEPVRGLSQREYEIVKLIASGLSAKKIADKLNVSERTITTHRARIMQKLHIHKSIDLVRYAMAHGLLDKNPAELE